MPPSITLDELVALNDEMLALVRAGVPLAQGLADVRHDVRGNLGRISGILAERMTRGETLPHILATEPRAISAALPGHRPSGNSIGRLAAALEETSASIRRLAALRRLVMLAMIYPLIVFFVCYGMFLFFAVKIAPLIYRAAPLNHPPAVLTSDRKHPQRDRMVGRDLAGDRVDVGDHVVVSLATGVGSPNRRIGAGLRLGALVPAIARRDSGRGICRDARTAHRP